jgi:hypothetical protein
MCWYSDLEDQIEESQESVEDGRTGCSRTLSVPYDLADKGMSKNLF